MLFFIWIWWRSSYGVSRNTYISKELKCRRHVWIFALSKNSEALSLSVTGRSASQFLLLRPDPDNNDDKALVYKSRRARKFIAHISVSPASYTPTLLWSSTSKYEWKFYLIKTYLIGLIFWARKFIDHISVSPASYTPNTSLEFYFKARSYARKYQT